MLGHRVIPGRIQNWLSLLPLALASKKKTLQKPVCGGDVARGAGFLVPVEEYWRRVHWGSDTVYCLLEGV